MEKVTAFLEKHVQWLGIGLGAAFVLWMVWTYVLNPPAQVSIGTTTLGPSEVDEYTEENVANRVRTEIDRPGSAIKLDVPQPVQQFTDAMSWKTAPPETADGALV